MSDFTFEELEERLAVRGGSGDPDSYTASLVKKGIAECAKKLGEEAVEAVIAAVERDPRRLTAEAADVIYHLLVLLQVSGIRLEEVKAELDRRTGETGLQEKARRSGRR